MPNIYLPQLDRTLRCEDGQNLYHLLASAGVLEGPCGGKGVCGKCSVKLNGTSVLACHYDVISDTEVLLPHKNEVCDIISHGYMKEFTPLPRDGCGIAVDIGTTTIVAALYDLSNGRELRSLSCLNSQKAFGQDVISRIHHTIENPDGLNQLRSSVAADLYHLTNTLLAQCGLSMDALRSIVAAGNTTMIHLLAGRSPASLASAPYLPDFEGPLRLDTNVALGLPISIPIDCIPAISSFVGGDITAGMVACGIDRNGPLTLLLDIGTNGEIVLAGNGGLYCCSCAAGPALEGMNISYGMRASEGAIEAVTLQNGNLDFQTIHNASPRGICGSGLISAISALRAGGVIQSSGRFADHPLVQKGPDGKFVLLDGAHGIYLSQKDIRQVQLAKGAIYSGILTLLEASGHTEADVRSVVVAGQFGAHLAGEDLVGCGFIPAAWANIITYAGNTSKSGAAICLLSPEEARRCERLSSDAHYVELSLLDGYQDRFISCLGF